MRILFLQPEYHINQDPLIRALRNRGHAVRFLTRGVRHTGTERALEPRLIGPASLPGHIFERFGVSRRGRKILAWPPIQSLNEEVTRFDPDIIIARNYHVYTAAAFVLAQWHGCRFALYTQDPAGTARRRILKSGVDRLVATIAADPVPVYTPSPSRGVHASHLRYVPFAVETAADRPFEEKPWSEDGRCSIITVSTYERRKRLPLLIQSIAEVAGRCDIHLDVYGAGAHDSNPEYQSCCDTIADCALDAHVSLHGEVPNARIRRRMYDADLFVLPSVREPASYSQLEAMAEGVPVICTESNGTAGYVDHQRSGMVIEPDSIGAVTDAIEVDCEERTVRVEAGRVGRAISASRHRPSHVADTFELHVLANLS
jgi:glycosyltransferase involved in cell wall biosynthesis